MKNLILICVLIVRINLPLFGQFEPFFKDSSTLFLLTIEFFDGADSGNPLLIKGDSIVDNKLYHKVYYWGEEVGLVRENVLSSKLWFWGENDGEERLIMDLDLVVGDTFNAIAPYFSNADIAVVQSIDSIDMRKRIIFDISVGEGYISEQLQFIEGIGPNASILYLTNESFDIAQLTCKKYENEELVFHYFPDLDNCLFPVGSAPNVKKYEVALYPNPLNDILNVDVKEPSKSAMLEILELTGKRLLKKPITTSNEIDMNNLGRGLYIYKIFMEDQVLSGKLLKM
jgi:Secretion system C-terminal sorting domain